MFQCSPLAVWENYCPVTKWYVSFPPSRLGHYLKRKTKGRRGASQERIPLSLRSLIMEIWLIYSGATMDWGFGVGGSFSSGSQQKVSNCSVENTSLCYFPVTTTLVTIAKAVRRQSAASRKQTQPPLLSLCTTDSSCKQCSLAHHIFNIQAQHPIKGMHIQCTF